PEVDHVSGEFESKRIQVSGLIVSEICRGPNHWNATVGLAQWLHNEGVPALSQVDTRAVTKRLRHHGTMIGSIGTDETPAPNLMEVHQEHMPYVSVNA